MNSFKFLGTFLSLFLLALVLAAPSFAVDDTEDSHSEDELETRKVDSEPTKETIDVPGLVEKSGSPAEPFAFQDTTIKPGTRRNLYFHTHVAGLDLRSPIIITHGMVAGPRVCLTAAVHGDELNGIEIARQVSYSLDPQTLRGTIISLPVVNIEGFIKQSRYLADRRDLNRFFPGHPDGSAPERIAYRIFHDIILHCHALIDLHTGSYYRSNLPQLRADLANDEVAEMVKGFGEMTALHSPGVPGMLRVEALKRGIPSVTMEIGGPLRLEQEAVKAGTKATMNYLATLGLLIDHQVFDGKQPTFYESKWLRATASGIFISDVEMGDKVEKDEVLGSIVNPINNNYVSVLSPNKGTILGKADNQFVAPGYAIYRLGYAKSEKQLQREAIERKRKDAEVKIKSGKQDLDKTDKTDKKDP